MEPEIKSKISLSVDSLHLNDPEPENEKLSKLSKKKNRRRLRKESSRTLKEDDLNAFFGNIKPVCESDSKGTVLRKRNGANRISISSFTTNNQPFIWHKHTAAQTMTRSSLERKKNKSDSDRVSMISTQSKLIKHDPKQHLLRQQRRLDHSNHHHMYEEYLPADVLQAGLEKGVYFIGAIRINPKCTKEAYVSHEDSTLPDYVIKSVEDRNRALEGDIVVLKILDENVPNSLQQRAKVVYILDMVHPRQALGFLQVVRENGKRYGKFIPRDKRLPRMRIAEETLPDKFFKSPKKYEHVLFLAEIQDWTCVSFAIGRICEAFGYSGDLRVETKALLCDNQINTSALPTKNFNNVLLLNGIPECERTYREDLRAECIFTVDPSTAKDLDDAVSCKKLPNGNFKVGVHIADVSYYIREESMLDKHVRDKGTSTYLVDMVHHMLPPELCMECSLLPGRDNMAFSVMWEMTSSADIISTSFTRSVINSTAQLSYEHAQKIIEDPNSEDHEGSFPYIYNGFKLKTICRTIRDLNSLAGMLREKRVEGGALRIDQTKYSFMLDSDSKPTSFQIQEIKDSNRMIEELMLLANISVAQRIYQDFPGIALLRQHAEPNLRMLSELTKALEIIGVMLKTQTSKAIQDSLTKHNPKDYLGYARFIALNHLLAKTMNRAKYVCSHEQIPHTLNHYALNVPLYTHFTSPIRRYADIMVHRLLGASLGYSPTPKWNPEWVRFMAEHCNKQKWNAKRASEASLELYMAAFVQENQPCITNAVVVSVQEKSFDVLTIRTGIPLRIYVNTFDKKIVYNTEVYGDTKKLIKMNVLFPESMTHVRVVQVIEIFQIVQIAIRRKPQTNKLEAFLVPPTQNSLTSPTNC